ncbi:MAG: hypothetical protein M1831_005873 [Alyxoria varia]|nr:MAG: hypothetical protein M1831_005873 [Alyxoria varia]
MAQWRATSFVLTWTVLGPSILVLAQQLSIRISVAIASLLGLAYIWGIANVVVPFFFGPLCHLPTPPNEGFWTGHFKATIAISRLGVFSEWMQEIPNEGLVHFRSLLHHRSLLLLTTPEVLFEVLNTRAYDFQKTSLDRQFLSQITGEGLIVVEGKEHNIQRRSVMPAFQGGHIKGLVPTFWEKATILADVLAADMSVENTAISGARTGTIDIGQFAPRITLDIIGKAALGRDFDTIHNSDDELARLYGLITDPANNPHKVLHFLVNACLPPWLSRSLPWKFNRDGHMAKDKLRVLYRQMVADKKATLAEKSVDENDILSILIKSGNFSDDGLVDQLLTFLIAGHETTSSALTWTTWVLSTHPHIQERLRSEIRQHIGQADFTVDASTIESLTYLGAVCDEVLRLYPTVPVTTREVTAEEGTTIGEQFVPKGTVVVIAPWAINRLPSLWGPDALDFNPSRWIHGQNANLGGAKTAYSKLTFLHGPRSCIGQNFARVELKCLLAALVLRFNIEMARPEEGCKVEPEGFVTVKPKHGKMLRLTEIL